ncbi:transcriptional regulator [Acinetobacter calcoaceticus]|uniref:transcriptional regulator n=1 Tax=Acinetobacter calcoaceticus TaxID=471 RepID=UPI0009ACAD53|nr:transcriptional regulator [Acinetobacter calcoaceticus]AQZ81546.1 transcriptional regulator [Acinetobacter calcoaceticus]
MSKVSIEMCEIARNSNHIILHHLATTNNGVLAEHLAMDASSFSRMINEKKNNGLTVVETCCELLSELGLKIVNAQDVYCSPEVAEATRVFLSNSFSSPDYMRILFK